MKAVDEQAVVTERGNGRWHCNSAFQLPTAGWAAAGTCVPLPTPSQHHHVHTRMALFFCALAEPIRFLAFGATSA